MVFGELVPKNLAIAHPLPTARATAGMQAAFSLIFKWAINGLNGSANWLVRRLGIEPAEELRSARSPQELGSLVRTSAQRGAIDKGTALLVNRSLRFGERTAEELMTPRVKIETLSTTDTVADLIDTASRTGFSRFPVDRRGPGRRRRRRPHQACVRGARPPSAHRPPQLAGPEGPGGALQPGR